MILRNELFLQVSIPSKKTLIFFMFCVLVCNVRTECLVPHNGSKTLTARHCNVFTHKLRVYILYSLNKYM